ncbi:hypothetical protein GCM10010524_14440 [Streptomyces mexicanus]
MLQAGEEDGLRGETVFDLRVGARPEDLDGHSPPKAHVDALIDVGHAARPDFSAQPVTAGQDVWGLRFR